MQGRLLAPTPQKLPGPRPRQQVTVSGSLWPGQAGAIPTRVCGGKNRHQLLGRSQPLFWLGRWRRLWLRRQQGRAVGSGLWLPPPTPSAIRRGILSVWVQKTLRS